MQAPEKIILSKRANYRIGFVVMLACLLFLAVGLGLASVSGAQPDELTLPAAVLGAIGIVVSVAVWIGVAISVANESREIRQVLQGDQWAQWQYQPDEWQREVEELYRIEQKMFRPHYNIIIGPILGAVMAGVALFVVKDPQVIPILLLAAGGVTLLFLATGLFLPLYYRGRTRARHRQRLAIRSPRLFISPQGMYHEAKGYTSLRNLTHVDYVNSQNPMILFTIRIRSGSRSDMDFNIPVAVTIPAGREEEARALVQRFRQQHKV